MSEYIRNFGDLEVVWDPDEVNLLTEKEWEEQKPHPYILFEAKVRKPHGGSELSEGEIEEILNHLEMKRIRVRYTHGYFIYWATGVVPTKKAARDVFSKSAGRFRKILKSWDCRGARRRHRDRTMNLRAARNRTCAQRFIPLIR